MKLYKVTTKAWGTVIPSREYIVRVEDGYVVHCEPTYRELLGMREDTLVMNASLYGRTVERIEQKMKTFLVQFNCEGKFAYMSVEALDAEAALAKFTSAYKGYAPLDVYERIGEVEEVRVPTYRIKR